MAGFERRGDQPRSKVLVTLEGVLYMFRFMYVRGHETTNARHMIAAFLSSVNMSHPLDSVKGFDHPFNSAAVPTCGGGQGKHNFFQPLPEAVVERSYVSLVPLAMRMFLSC